MGFFYTSDGVVHVGDVMVVFLHKDLIKSGRSSMSAEWMHLMTVETRMDRTR